MSADLSTLSYEERVLLATLHYVGSEIRIASDQRLLDILGAASKTYPEAYDAFRLHPVYGDSKTLRRLLQLFDQGAAIVRQCRCSSSTWRLVSAASACSLK